MALNPKVFATRAATATVFVAVLLSCICFNYVSFSALFFVVSLWGLHEFYQLSEKLGAKQIVAIDHDQMCLENGLENVERNKCSRINILKGDAALIPKIKFDRLLANINRNIIMEDLKQYAGAMHSKAIAVFSGFYEVDLRSITAEAFKFKLHLKSQSVKSNWCVAVFEKE